MRDSLTVANEILFAEVSSFLKEGNEVVISTKGSSMLPFIREGQDSVKLIKKEKAEKGDIVLAEIAPGKYILHRVYATDGDSITLMGDGNLRGTEHCRQEDIRGTVVEITDKEGNIRKLTKGRFWKALLPIRRILLGIYRRIV